MELINLFVKMAKDVTDVIWLGGVIPDCGARKFHTKFTYVSCDTWQVVFIFSAWSSIVLKYIWIQYKKIIEYCI